MKFQSTDTNHYLSDKKAKFHHNRVVIFNIVLTLLISLSILGYAMYFNNNSTVVYSSTFTNFEPKNTIQIYSNSSSKIHFDSLCTTYFDDIIHIQIQSQKGLDNYSFEVFCKSGNQQNHLGWSYFASGNFNLTINYTPAKGVVQNASLFTVVIREYHGNVRDIQIYDNLFLPFLILSFACLIFQFTIYFISKNETWDQLQEIILIQRNKRIQRDQSNQEKSTIDFRIIKIPGFIKNRRFLLVIVSYVLLYLVSADSNATYTLIYSFFIIFLIIYESVSHPNLDYISISTDYISFKFRIGEPFILYKDSIKNLRFEIGKTKSLNGISSVKRIVLVTKEDEIFYINLTKKLKELLSNLNKFGWIEEENLSNSLTKLNKDKESWTNKLLKLYYYNPVICTACSTDNNLDDSYCKKCGAELIKRTKLTTKVLKVTPILLLIYFSVDLVAFLFCYLVFIGPLKTTHLGYDFFRANYSSSTFAIISWAIIIIANIVYFIHIKLFGIFLTKLEPSKATAEYSALYLAVPAIHEAIFFIIVIMVRYLQSLYLFFFSFMLLLGEWFLIAFYFVYRIMKILFKVNYLINLGHLTREEKISLEKVKMDERKKLF